MTSFPICNNSPSVQPAQVKLDMSHDLIAHVLEEACVFVAQKNDPHLDTRNRKELFRHHLQKGFNLKFIVHTEVMFCPWLMSTHIQVRHLLKISLHLEVWPLYCRCRHCSLLSYNYL